MSTPAELQARLVSPPDPVSLVDINPQAEDYDKDFDNIRNLEKMKCRVTERSPEIVKQMWDTIGQVDSVINARKKKLSMISIAEEFDPDQYGSASESDEEKRKE